MKVKTGTGEDEMKEYLIRDYTSVEPDAGEKFKMQVVDEEKLFEIIQGLKDKPRKIAIYRLGDCILDWS